MCKTPLLTALSHNWYALETAAFKASLSSPVAKAKAFFNAVLIGDLLFSMTEKYNKTLILVTHDMKLAEKGDYIYSIKDGCFNEK